MEFGQRVRKESSLKVIMRKANLEIVQQVGPECMLQKFNNVKIWALHPMDGWSSILFDTTNIAKEKRESDRECIYVLSVMLIGLI